MRKLLICTGLCLTAGAFVAAERLTSSSAQAVALKRQVSQEARIERLGQSNAELSAEIAFLESERNSAHAEVASLRSSVDEMAAARDHLETQVIEAKSTTKAIRETLEELETANLKLIEEIEVRDASLIERAAERNALKSDSNNPSQDEVSTSKLVQENAKLVAEIASLNKLLESRDETILALRGLIGASEANTVDANSKESGGANSALIDDLQVPLTTIYELTKADTADPTVESANDQPRKIEALLERFAELTELVDLQKETISNLRMGFESEAASPLEMASACVDRANKILEFSQIRFKSGTSRISKQSTVALDHLRDLAIGCEHNDLFIEIGGHTDSVGAESTNLTLSEARANSVRDFLIGRGIPEETMVAVGFGESQPIASNETPFGRAQNRRITFTWQMREEGG